MKTIKCEKQGSGDNEFETKSVVTPMKWEEMDRKSTKWEQECHDDEEARTETR